MSYLDLPKEITREEEALYTLVRYSCTANMLIDAATMWINGFKTPTTQNNRRSRLRMMQRLLRQLYLQGLVDKVKARSNRIGQPVEWYFVTRKAGGICAEVEEEYQAKGKKSPIFTGPDPQGANYHHTVGTSMYANTLERSLGQLKTRAKLLLYQRDQQLQAEVRKGHPQKNKLIPDGWHIIEIDGTPTLIFNELKLTSSRQKSTNSRFIGKSESYKFELYLEWFHSGKFTTHPIIAYWQEELNFQFKRFYVHYITYRRPESYRQSLMRTARSICPPELDWMFRFAQLEEMVSENLITGKGVPQNVLKNVLEHKVWQQSSGKKLALLPYQRASVNHPKKESRQQKVQLSIRKKATRLLHYWTSDNLND
jgi:hypothetical protein